MSNSISPSADRRAGGRLGVLLGTAETGPLLRRVAESFAIGLAVVLVALAAAYHPTPHALAVGVVPSSLTATVTPAVTRAHPGAYRFVTEPTLQAAVTGLRDHSIWGAITAAPHATLYVAGANGPTVTATLVGTFSPLIAASGQHLTVVDVVPAKPGDSGGTSLFSIAFGTLLGGYLLAISSFTRAHSLPTRSHLITSALYAVTIGVIVAAASSWLFNVTPGHFPVVALIVALLGMAAGSATFLFLSISRSIGTVVAAIVLLAIANTAGGVLPPPFLPRWLAPASNLFPQGIALASLKGAIYFGGSGLLGGLLGLVLWVTVPVAAVNLVHSRPSTDGRAGPSLEPKLLIQQQKQ